MAYERKVVSSDVEKQIITAMIVSTNFLSRTAPLIDFDFFVNDYARNIAEWTVNYYNKYKKAPEGNIQKIFEANKKTLDRSVAELISTFLSKTSKEYVEKQGINDDYIHDNAKLYFGHRELELMLSRAQGCLLEGKDNEARDILSGKSILSKAVGGWENAFGRDNIRKALISEENEEDILFRMPGALGDLFGPIKKGWLIGILGAFKRGKSWLAQEFALAALLESVSVAFFSLEMTIKECRLRFYNRISGELNEGDFFFPVFDCLKNQTGECDSPNRTNNMSLRSSAKEKLKYTEGYSPCTYCRDNKNSLYLPETYFIRIVIPKKSMREKVRHIESFETMYGNNLWFKSFPRGTATIDDIKYSLDTLEFQENFIPQLIIVDQADNLKSNLRMSGAKPHHLIDDIWKSLSALGQERMATVVSPSQGNRAFLKKIQSDETDLAEWIGKLGHVDIFSALNQTPVEKKKGVSRISLLAHRHKEFNTMDNVIVLQHLNTGQALLDSEVAKHYHISKGRYEEDDGNEECIE